jgi:hypothetical protein
MISNYLQAEQSQATTADDTNEYIVIGDEIEIHQRGISPGNRRNHSLGNADTSGAGGGSSDRKQACLKR